jgi:hypothetical protein
MVEFLQEKQSGMSRKNYGLKKMQNFEIIVIDVTNEVIMVDRKSLRPLSTTYHKRGRNL